MDKERDRRDAAGVGPYPQERDRLVPLSSLGNWQISRGEPDIRGWEIRTVSGRQLGVVRDLLIDREAGEAVLLEVDLPGTARNAFVPIRVAQIDRATRVVLMDSADLSALEAASPIAAAATPEVRRDGVPTAEVVVDRRPIVEETVVRRREPDTLRASDIAVEDAAGLDEAARIREEERRRGERRRIDRMGTDL